MLEVVSEWWGTIISSTAAVLSGFGVYVVKTVHRLDRDKADRGEVSALKEWMEEHNKEARQSRREIHQKLDASMASQSEINREMARYMGRINGRHDGG